MRKNIVLELTMMQCVLLQAILTDAKNLSHTVATNQTVLLAMANQQVEMDMLLETVTEAIEKLTAAA